MNPNAALKQYGQVSAHGGVMDASPHRLIQMLMEGAITRVLSARGHMERGKTADKGSQISMAISIIDGLRLSLDRERGGEIATNLEGLYEYMGRRLLEANLNNDLVILDEVLGILREIKGAWDQIDAAEAAAPPVTAEPSPVASGN